MKTSVLCLNPITSVSSQQVPVSQDQGHHYQFITVNHGLSPAVTPKQLWLGCKQSSENISDIPIFCCRTLEPHSGNYMSEVSLYDCDDGKQMKIREINMQCAHGP